MKNSKISQVNVEAGQSASLPARHSLQPSVSRSSLFMTAMLAMMLIPAAQMQSKAQAIVPEYVPLSSSQLDQLVAPIALDPDPLVAQILIGCTFPDEVTDANNWVSTKVNLTPDQRATAANSMNWDPSIKGLIVFPLVLDSMAKNNAWTTQLGNAYYNQPDDVMDAIQAMRSSAYQSHALVATAQQNVVVNADVIEVLPVNPDAVFVPYYNPWTVFAAEITAFPGFAVEPVPAGLVVADGISFDPAVSVGLDAHFGFSFGGWAPGWGGGAVVYNNNVYNSNSRTVANHGQFGGHETRAGYGHDGRQGSGRNLSTTQHNSARLGSTGRTGSSNRSGSLRNTSIARTSSTARSTMGSRNTAANRSSATNRPAARNASTTRTNSARSNSMSRTASSNRMGQPASTGRSQAANRSMSQSRSTAQSRPASQSRSTSPAMNRSNSTGRSTSASSSMGRTGSANRTASNSSMGRPASSNSFGGHQATSRPAAANRSFGGGQSMNHSATGRTGGGSFGGGHAGGGHMGGKR
jgi:hypothetical protein